MTLSPADLDRHRRHILLKEIGGPGVQKLRAAHVTLIGAGALGGPAALYLAAAGVGHIEIWDADRVERSNLQRQIQFSEADIGALKADTLAARLRAIDPGLAVSPKAQRFTSGDAVGGDILIDASDNYETRFALNRLAITTRRPLVHGAATGWRGEVSVFAAGTMPGAPCYRCLVPETPPGPEACDDVGVVGAVTGIIGAALALEALKLITGAGEPLIGRLLLVEGLSLSPRTLRLNRDPACPDCH
jgi:molybdopterin-synthase adenylyltransferase